MTYIPTTPSTSYTPTSSSSSSSSPTYSFSPSKTYTSSPIRHSPLSQPPILASARTPSPSHNHRHRYGHDDISHPIPTPSPTSNRRLSSRYSRQESLSPLDQSSLNSPASSPTRLKRNPPSSPQPTGDETPSPPLSRSHPLLGSYHLSLLHSRMSHAHQPHSLISGFSLHIKGIGKGKNCLKELRCPSHIEIPFSATYYDLDNPESSPTSSPSSHSSSNSSKSPWTGNIDLEQYYFTTFSPHSHDPIETETVSPPSFPGYRIAPLGQLQILIRTEQSPIKVFLIPYDLRKIPLGGRLLVREKTYRLGGRNDHRILKYAIQLQFVCIPSHTLHTSHDSLTTRQQRVNEAFNGDQHGPPSGSGEKAYYVSKMMKVVFVSTPPHSTEIMDVERTDEIIEPPSIAPEDLSLRTKKARKGSFAFSPGSLGKRSEEWAMVRNKWIAKESMRNIHQEESGSESDQQKRSDSTSSKRDSDLLVIVKPKMDRRPSLLTTTLPSSTSAQSINAGTNTATGLSPVSILSPLPVRPGTLSRSRPSTPTSPRPISPGPPLIWSPTSQRRMRREDGLEEVELSERLRKMHVGKGSE
ncbi:uncharacterized protein IL334_004813 [Kwoniella shivajii]|uniref:Atos-like conserved domain-containing protein n=1 Tax=Kwoniella shivajii TaxID=564305 RepID=A0ABZ1D1E1_9TREE|nr:hypothetical protein IL334_004813 [Kwoniella shivajii]